MQRSGPLYHQSTIWPLRRSCSNRCWHNQLQTIRGQNRISTGYYLHPHELNNVRDVASRLFGSIYYGWYKDCWIRLIIYILFLYLQSNPGIFYIFSFEPFFFSAVSSSIVMDSFSLISWLICLITLVVCSPLPDSVDCFLHSFCVCILFFSISYHLAFLLALSAISISTNY